MFYSTPVIDFEEHLGRLSEAQSLETAVKEYGSMMRGAAKEHGDRLGQLSGELHRELDHTVRYEHVSQDFETLFTAARAKAWGMMHHIQPLVSTLTARAAEVIPPLLGEHDRSVLEAVRSDLVFGGSETPKAYDGLRSTTGELAKTAAAAALDHQTIQLMQYEALTGRADSVRIGNLLERVSEPGQEAAAATLDAFSLAQQELDHENISAKQLKDSYAPYTRNHSHAGRGLINTLSDQYTYRNILRAHVDGADQQVIKDMARRFWPRELGDIVLRQLEQYTGDLDEHFLRLYANSQRLQPSFDYPAFGQYFSTGTLRQAE